MYFDPSYEGNPAGQCDVPGDRKAGDIAKGAACGSGTRFFYVGATTGRDGLGARPSPAAS